MARNPGLPNPDISKIIGEKWRLEPDEVKNSWKKLAEEEKARHQRQYPDYRYQPRRGGKNANARQGQCTDDGRCSKCGGRFIATPRTPSTPVLVGQGQSMPFSHPQSGPRSADDVYGPRPGQLTGSAGGTRAPGYLYHAGDGWREAGDTYMPLSPSPDRKRRRATSSGAYYQTQHSAGQPSHAVPQHGRHPSFGAQPVSQQPFGRQPLQSPRSMAPPPRPQVITSQGHPPRGRSFDDSLRLPPLQTQTPITQSPASADTNSRFVSPTGAFPSTVNSHAKSAEAVIMSIPYIDKIKTLCHISPPLPAYRLGSPRGEIRGPLIAVDGPRLETLRGVATAVERALSNAEEVALKIWGGDDAAPLAEAEVTMEDTPAGKAHTEVSRCCVSYLSRMIQWYERSNEIIQHITTQPSPVQDDTIMCAQRTHSEGGVTTTPRSTTETTDVLSLPVKTPVALVPTGFSLTLTDKFACATPIADSYAAVDHWSWMASFWRGIVGPDLFIYVKPSSEQEIKRLGGVELKSAGIMVVRIEDGSGIDEALQRRLAFEVLEWVRGGSYRAGT